MSLMVAGFDSWGEAGTVESVLAHALAMIDKLTISNKPYILIVSPIDLCPTATMVMHDPSIHRLLSENSSKIKTVSAFCDGDYKITKIRLTGNCLLRAIGFLQKHIPAGRVHPNPGAASTQSPAKMAV